MFQIHFIIIRKCEQHQNQMRHMWRMLAILLASTGLLISSIDYRKTQKKMEPTAGSAAGSGLLSLCQVAKFHAIRYTIANFMPSDLTTSRKGWIICAGAARHPHPCQGRVSGTVPLTLLTPLHSSTLQSPQSCTRPHRPPSGRSAVPSPSQRRQACRSR